MPARWIIIVCVAAAACGPPRPLQNNASFDLVVAATTDVHGRLPGLSRAATIIDSLRHGASVFPVVVDAGDFLQGNPLAYVAARVDTEMPHPVIAAMTVVTYDAVVIGNHEFNYGLPTLNRAIRQADFAMLAANVYTPDGKQPFRPWAVSTRRGIKIAIVGATTPGSMLWERENLAGRLVIRDIVP